MKKFSGSKNEKIEDLKIWEYPEIEKILIKYNC